MSELSALEKVWCDIEKAFKDLRDATESNNSVKADSVRGSITDYAWKFLEIYKAVEKKEGEGEAIIGNWKVVINGVNVMPPLGNMVTFDRAGRYLPKKGRDPGTRLEDMVGELRGPPKNHKERQVEREEQARQVEREEQERQVERKEQEFLNTFDFVKESDAVEEFEFVEEPEEEKTYEVVTIDIVTTKLDLTSQDTTDDDMPLDLTTEDDDMPWTVNIDAAMALYASAMSANRPVTKSDLEGLTFTWNAPGVTGNTTGDVVDDYEVVTTEEPSSFNGSNNGI